MDDFFSSAPGAGTNNSLTYPAPAADPDELSSFEAAIGMRFGGASPSSLLTTRLAGIEPSDTPSVDSNSAQFSSSTTLPAFSASGTTSRMPVDPSIPAMRLSMPKPLATPSFAGASRAGGIAAAHPHLVGAGHFPRTPMPMANDSVPSIAARRAGALALSPPTPSRTPSGPLSQLSLQSPSKTGRPSGSSAGGSNSAGPGAKGEGATKFIGHSPSDLPAILQYAASPPSPTTSSATPRTFPAEPASKLSSSSLSLSLRKTPPPSPTSSSSSLSLKSNHNRRVLIVDIRNRQHFVASRIATSINLSVPSTLLKRPAFSLSKLAEMIPQPSERIAFSSWNQTASKIIVYDGDTGVLSAGNNVLGLLNKFHNEGFKGELGYVIGGFSAVVRNQPSVVNQAPLERISPADETPAGTLGSRQLPTSAFQQATTGNIPGIEPTQVAVANPFYDNIRQNLELSSGVSERIPLIVPPAIVRRQAELPFQWLRDIVEKASAKSADGIIGGEALEDLAMQFYRIELGEQRRLNGIMEHHSNEDTTDIVAGGKKGKKVGNDPITTVQDQLDEDATMQSTDPAFPYSITAGVEKGAKNRYRNIWPFEHARVRLQNPADKDGAGYINASYVQPRGTGLKYIATQGPLAATFTDFWTLVWEQNVSIIVMLTQQIEGHSIKCHCYWKNERFGPLALKSTGVQGPAHLEKDILGDEAGAAGVTGFDFQTAASGPASSPQGDFSAHGTAVRQPDEGVGEGKDDEELIIRRTFLLSHDDHPDVPPRKIVQLQFLGWPDLNVPSSSQALLKLVQQLDDLRTEFHSMGGTRAINPTSKEHNGQVQPGPVLVHCSAGVGRTGSFVIIDAVLDAIRREARSKMLKNASGSSADSSNAASSGKGKGREEKRQSSGETLDLGSDDEVTSTKSVARSARSLVPYDGPGGGIRDAATDADIEDAGDRPRIVKLGSDGNEVDTPDKRTVKKRKSSLADSSGVLPAMGSSAKLRSGSMDLTPDNGPGISSSPPPPVPPIPSFKFPSGRSAPPTATSSLATTPLTLGALNAPSSVSGTPIDLDSRKLHGLRSKRGTSMGGSGATDPLIRGSPANASVDSLMEASMSAASSGASAFRNFSGASGSASASARVTNSPAPITSTEESPALASKGKVPEQREASQASFRAPAPPPSIPLVLPDFAKKKLAAHSLSTAATTGNSPVPTPPNDTSGSPSSASPRPGTGLLKQALPDPVSSSTHNSPPPPTVPENLPSPWRSGPSQPYSDSQDNASSTFASNEPRARFASFGPSGSEMITSASNTGDGHHKNDSSEPGAKTAYDYAPPRRIWLNKEVKHNVRAAQRASANAAASSALSTPYLSHLRGFAVASPSPLATNVITPVDMLVDAIPDAAGIGATETVDTAESTDEKELSSSEEFTPSSPESLNGIDEPIRQVLEDMREQRMSLCQTLRQYVFVHLAVLEGSLEIVDQLAMQHPVDAGRTKLSGIPSPPPLLPHARSRSGVSIDHSNATKSVDGFLPISSSMLLDDASTVPSTDGTRVASSFYAKRPSVKRKKRSTDSQSPQYEKMNID